MIQTMATLLNLDHVSRRKRAVAEKSCGEFLIVNHAFSWSLASQKQTNGSHNIWTHPVFPMTCQAIWRLTLRKTTRHWRYLTIKLSGKTRGLQILVIESDFVFSFTLRIIFGCHVMANSSTIVRTWELSITILIEASTELNSVARIMENVTIQFSHSNSRKSKVGKLNISFTFFLSSSDCVLNYKISFRCIFSSCWCLRSLQNMVSQSQRENQISNLRWLENFEIQSESFECFKKEIPSRKLCCWEYFWCISTMLWSVDL